MALKGKQKKLDKNNNGRIDAEDFKILQGSKKGMRMGGMAGYGAARTSGMGLQDESMQPGKVMKARSGKSVDKKDFIKRRLELGSLKSLFKSVGDFPLVKGTGETDAYIKRRMKLSGGKKMGGVMKARGGTLAESMKKLREKAYDKSGKKYKGVGRYGKDEYMIQKKLPGMRTGKYVFDMVGVKPMSGLNKDKKKKDGFLDDVFEKTIKRYGLKDPTKKK